MKNVTAALMIQDGKIFIARRKIGQHLEALWEFPGGKVESGESPEECLAREIHEEFGVHIEVGTFFMESIYKYDSGAIRLLGYIVDSFHGEFVPTVHDEYSWVKLEALLEYELAPADIPIAQALIDGGRDD